MLHSWDGVLQINCLTPFSFIQSAYINSAQTVQFAFIRLENIAPECKVFIVWTITCDALSFLEIAPKKESVVEVHNFFFL